MVKQIYVGALLIVATVSCTPVNQREFIPTEVPTIASTPTSSQTQSTSGNEPQMVFFISEQGKFQAWVPVAGNIVEYTTTRALFGKPIQCSIIGFALNSASVTLQYCDLASEELSSLSDQAIIEEVCNTMKSEMQLRIDHEEMEVVEGSYPSLTISGTESLGGNPGTFKARIILAGNRIYFVHMYVYHIDWCNCRHQMDQVVDSFFVDPNLSIPFEPTP